MATITITRGLNEQKTGVICPLVSAFQQNSIEFTFERGTLTNTYAKVIFEGVTFDAMLKTKNYATNTDLYYLDLTTKLPYLLSIIQIYRNILNPTNLIHTFSYQIVGYNDLAQPIANITSPTTYLNFGVEKVGLATKMNDVYVKGSSMPIYHTGIITFFSIDGGSVNLTLNGITKTYSLNASKYNTILLEPEHRASGTLTGGTSISIPLIYRGGRTGEVLISYLDSDGKLQYQAFVLRNTDESNKMSNEVSLYGETNSTTYKKSLNLTSDNTTTVTLDTIAVDTEHFRQLCEIKRSPFVIIVDSVKYGNQYWSVKSCPTTTAECNQNLKFTLVLEREENAISY